jgi:ATP-dependent Clp protease ATP-binding subunit ClpC
VITRLNMSTDEVDLWTERESEVQQRLDQMRINSTAGENVNVTAEDIAEVLSMWTGIPVYQFTEEESARLLRMEEELRKHIVGTRRSY